MKTCLMMARVNHTPVTFWLELPLLELGEWVQTAMNMQGKGS